MNLLGLKGAPAPGFVRLTKSPPLVGHHDVGRLYAGQWDGEPVCEADYVISAAGAEDPELMLQGLVAVAETGGSAPRAGLLPAALQTSQTSMPPSSWPGPNPDRAGHLSRAKIAVAHTRANLRVASAKVETLQGLPVREAAAEPLVQCA